MSSNLKSLMRAEKRQGHLRFPGRNARVSCILRNLTFFFSKANTQWKLLNTVERKNTNTLARACGVRSGGKSWCSPVSGELSNPAWGSGAVLQVCILADKPEPFSCHTLNSWFTETVRNPSGIFVKFLRLKLEMLQKPQVFCL